MAIFFLVWVAQCIKQERREKISRPFLEESLIHHPLVIVRLSVRLSSSKESETACFHG